MIRTGWVRIHVMTPNIGSLIEGHVIAVGPNNEWGLAYMADRVTPWRLDDETHLTTIVSLINRFDPLKPGDPTEVIVESWWHAQDGTTLNRIYHECYYGQQLLLDARVYTVPGAEGDATWPPTDEEAGGEA